MHERVRHDRRDRLGRRIGHNWWREYNTTLLMDATLAWERQCEHATYGYATEMAEYAAILPRPNLKEFLLANKGMYQQQGQAEAVA